MALSAYTAATLVIAAATPTNILTAIKALTYAQGGDPNCPGSSTELILYVESGTILIGNSNITAALYGYSLPATSSRLYRAGSRGDSIPLGRLWAFSTAGGVLHVEVVL